MIQSARDQFYVTLWFLGTPVRIDSPAAPAHFSRAESLRSALCLHRTPLIRANLSASRRFQSGELDVEGHTSNCGDAGVRSTLYVAENAMMTRSSRWSPFKAWGMQLAKTRGHRRAVIAVARKLSVILHRMWIDDTQFRWGAVPTRS